MPLDSLALPLADQSYDFICVVARHRTQVAVSHYPIWPPGKMPSSSEEMMRYPGAYLALRLNWDKFKPRRAARYITHDYPVVRKFSRYLAQ